MRERGGRSVENLDDQADSHGGSPCGPGVVTGLLVVEEFAVEDLDRVRLLDGDGGGLVDHGRADLG